MNLYNEGINSKTEWIKMNKKYNYEDLKDLTYEELKAIEQQENERLWNNEQKRQQLIQKIIWMSRLEDFGMHRKIISDPIDSQTQD